MFPLFLRTLARRLTSSRTAPRRPDFPRKRRLIVEPLECRSMMAAGALDPTFAGDGTVVTDISGNRFDYIEDMALQSDGKIVVAGRHKSASKGEEFALVRYNANGSLDGTFGSGGKVVTTFGTKDDGIMGIAFQSDGKIVAGGYTTVSNMRTFGLARYNVNGTLDSTFDGDGKLTTNVVSLSEGINDVVIQPDGKIIAVGYAEVASGVSDFALVRYNTNGSLDTSFGSGGKVTTSGTTNADAVALQADGKIVVSGRANIGEGAIVRYNANGSLDTSFSGNGLLENALAESVRFSGVAIQSNGMIVTTDIYREEVERWDASGNIDTTFAGDGSADVYSYTLYDVAMQADGKILATGSGSGPSYGLLVFRFNVDGTRDATFGIAGIAEAEPGPINAAGVGKSVLVQPDGRIVAAGFQANGVPPWEYPNWNVLVARFEGASTAGALAALLFDDSLSPQKKKR